MTDRQTDRQTDRDRETETGRQTERGGNDRRQGDIKRKGETSHCETEIFVYEKCKGKGDGATRTEARSNRIEVRISQGLFPRLLLTCQAAKPDPPKSSL